MRFFFYGSLLDPAIRRAVIGHAAGRLAIVPARLEHWRRCRMGRSLYPALLRKPGAAVHGGLVAGVDAATAARLAAFEGPAYRVARVSVRLTDGGITKAYVFLPTGRCGSPALWDLAAWLRGSRRHALRLARAQMARDSRLSQRTFLTAWRRRARGVDTS